MSAEEHLRAGPPFPDGPYLSAAFACERILEEKDNVKSAIRIIDRVTHTVTGPNPPEEMQPFDYQFTLFVRFKSGWIRGPRTLRVRLQKPSGETAAPLEMTLYFEGEEDRGVDVIIPSQVRFDMPGLYWFLIELDNRRVTQVPLRVIYIRQPMQIGGRGAPPPSA